MVFEIIVATFSNILRLIEFSCNRNIRWRIFYLNIPFRYFEKKNIF